MSEAKRGLGFTLFVPEPTRPGGMAGGAVSPLSKGGFSRRVRNEKTASVFKRFLVAHVAFRAISESFSVQGTLRFEPVNVFVERTLFVLKEECHALFRRRGRPVGEVHFIEDLFDVLVGSIFHTMMKVKENCYILECYGPTYKQMAEIAARRTQMPDYERLFFQVCRRIVERAAGAVVDDMRLAGQLFDDAKGHLLAMLPRFAYDSLITRMLLENDSLVEMVYEETDVVTVLRAMYDGRLSNAYLHAAASYLESGWVEKALLYCEKSLQEEPDNVGAQRLMGRLRARP